MSHGNNLWKKNHTFFTHSFLAYYHKNAAVFSSSELLVVLKEGVEKLVDVAARVRGAHVGLLLGLRLGLGRGGYCPRGLRRGS